MCVNGSKHSQKLGYGLNNVQQSSGVGMKYIFFKHLYYCLFPLVYLYRGDAKTLCYLDRFDITKYIQETIKTVTPVIHIETKINHKVEYWVKR